MSVALSRRDLIAGGIAVAFLPVVGGILASGGQPFVYDKWLDPDGRLLAQARRSGLRPIPAGDIGRIAQAIDTGRLDGVAGVTSTSAFFIVEQLAQRRGLRLRHRRGPSWSFGAVDIAPRGRML